MENLNEKLKEQLQEIRQLLRRSNKSLVKFEDVPNGHINMSISNGSYQYYYVDPNSKTRKYMKTEDLRMVKRIIQRDYERRLNRDLVRLEKTLSKFVERYDIDDLTNAYLELHEGRRKLVTPFITTQDEIIQEWLKDNPGMQNPYPEEGIFRTDRGEMVRSKSEKIIADTLLKKGVPYQYEPMLELEGYYVIYPDFVILNTRTEKTIYWEHLGLASDMEYAVKNFKKIQQYEACGYLLGRDLIITMETSERPLDTRIVEKKIQEFLI